MSIIEIPSLSYLCIETISFYLEDLHSNIQIINELCKTLSSFQHLLNPLLEILLKKQVITDVALIQFLVPNRYELICPHINYIKKSTLKMIGYNCINLVSFNSLLLSLALYSILYFLVFYFLSFFVEDIKSNRMFSSNQWCCSKYFIWLSWIERSYFKSLLSNYWFCFWSFIKSIWNLIRLFYAWDTQFTGRFHYRNIFIFSF